MQCWLWPQRRPGVCHLKQYFQFGAKFSTGQDGAIRSVGEELKSTAGISCYQNSLSIRSPFLYLLSITFLLKISAIVNVRHGEVKQQEL